MIIDSHQHFWDRALAFDYDWLDSPDLLPINRNFLPSDLKPVLESCGVDRSIVVQTQHNVEENRWALNLAKENLLIAGVVGWVDLASRECEDQLAEFQDDRMFVGVRHVTQDEPDDNFILRSDVLEGLKVLEKNRVPFDLLFYAKHLQHAATLAKLLPGLPMVIDHISKPEIKSQQLAQWKIDIQKAALSPNMYCKLSGMITEADWENWSVSDLLPYVEIVLEAFGPSRCMYGSDWPICLLAGKYEQVYLAMREMLSSLSESEQAQVFGQTAIDFYRLDVSR